MIVQGVFRRDLRIVSKESAKEFYKGVKSVILISFSKSLQIRVEPGQHISLIPVESVKNGSAMFVPSYFDEDGALAYRYRRFINNYLKDM